MVEVTRCLTSVIAIGCEPASLADNLAETNVSLILYRFSDTPSRS